MLLTGPGIRTIAALRVTPACNLQGDDQPAVTGLFKKITAAM